jgi:hypothetical protein
VYEDINKVRFNHRETSFVMDMDDCKLGFTHLRLVQCNQPNILQWCKQVGNYIYLSNEFLKTYIIPTSQQSDVLHHVRGPSLSNKYDAFDHVPCFYSREWTSPDHKWITRPNSSWPSSELKSKIIDHGVLFVPIGCRGSKNEDIEWRLSFTVGEKLLIYTFTHVRLI